MAHESPARTAHDVEATAAAAPRQAAVARWAALALALAAAGAPSLLYPGDAPWICDEPTLIDRALRANAAHALATEGLMGTKGAVYGPFAVWVYQLLLVVSHDPVVLVLLHAILMAGATSLALHWLARTLRLWPWFAVVVALSPYLWFYGRLLWDNSFNLPASALAVAAYASFLATRSRAALLATVACLLVAPLIHLMSLALVAPIALHLVFLERRAAWQARWGILSLVACAALASWRYWRLLIGQVASGGSGTPAASASGFLFPLSGGRMLTGTGLEYFLGEGWGAAPLVAAAVTASALGYALVWAGMAIAAVRVVRVLRGSPASALDHVAGICLAIWLAQTLLDGLTGSFHHPHYLNATWIAYAVLAWLAVDLVARFRPGRAAIVLHGAALAAVTVSFLLRVHAAGGARGIHYGPTLANQVEVAVRIEQFAPGSAIYSDVENYVRFPQALGVLRALVRPAAGPARLPPARLFVRYRSGDPGDARVEVVAR